MKILLVSATSNEVQPFLKKFELNAGASKKIGSSSVMSLITGVGMVATTYHLTRMLSQEKFDLALNAGISGAFDRSLQPGELVNIIEDHFSELGAEDHDRFLDLPELSLANPDEFPFSNNRLKGRSAAEYLRDVKDVSSITVNMAHGSEQRIRKTIERFNPQVESMEGAAFMYCCLMEKVPFFQIRTISNYVEPRNRDAWQIPLAVKNLNAGIEKLILNHS